MRQLMRRTALGCVASSMACAPAPAKDVPKVDIAAGAMAPDWRKNNKRKHIPGCVDFEEYKRAHYEAEVSIMASCDDKKDLELSQCRVKGFMQEYSKEDSILYHYQVSVVLEPGKKIPNLFFLGTTIDEPDRIRIKVLKVHNDGVVFDIWGSGFCRTHISQDLYKRSEVSGFYSENVPYGMIVNPGMSNVQFFPVSSRCTYWGPTLYLVGWKNARVEKAGNGKAVLHYQEQRPFCSDANNETGGN